MGNKLKRKLAAWVCLTAIAGSNVFGNASSVAYAAEDEGYPRRLVAGNCNHNCLDSWECLEVLEPDELKDEVAMENQKAEEAASKEESRQQKREEAEAARAEAKESSALETGGGGGREQRERR